MDTQKKIRVLVVDDHPSVRAGAKSAMELEPDFEVSTAGNSVEARRLMADPLAEPFDCLVSDVDLKEGIVTGFEIARWFAEFFPATARVIFSANIAGQSPRDLGFTPDGVVDKSVGTGALVQIIRNAVWRKKMPPKVRRKRFAAMQSLLEYSPLVEVIGRTGDNQAERVDVRLATDGSATAFVVYSIPESTEDRIVVALPPCVGCVGGCAMCKSGCHHFVRNLTREEMAALALLGLETHLARELFEPGGQRKKVRFSWTTEGDSGWSNLKAVCQTIQLLMELEAAGISLSEFVITTIGNIERLRWFLNSEFIDLPIRIYWSLNSMVQEIRAGIMPVAGTQPIPETWDVLRQIAVKTGREVTASYVLIDGLPRGNNYRDEDVRMLGNLFAGQPVRIGLKLLEEDSPGGFHRPTDEAADEFERKLVEVAGLRVKRQSIVGGAVNAGCGTTASRLDL